MNHETQANQVNVRNVVIESTDNKETREEQNVVRATGEVVVTHQEACERQMHETSRNNNKQTKNKQKI